MDLKEAKSKFVHAWGALGSNWGINRTMAQIHALLMVSDESLTTEDIMDYLGVSRGNANMNLRALIEWGLIHRELKQGERKEYFIAERVSFQIAKKIIIERRKREIEPIKNVLTELKQIDKGATGKPEKAFVKTIHDIEDLVLKMDRLADKVSRADENWFLNALLKVQ